MDETYFDENGVERYVESDEVVSAPSPAAESAPVQVSAPASVAPVAVAPAAAPVAAPVVPPRNRMYMGENTGDPNASPQQFFDVRGTPSNSFIAPPPPQLSDEEQAATVHRVAEATGGESDADMLARLQQADRVGRPGSQTISVSRPPMPTPDEEMIRIAQQYQIPLGQAEAAYETSQRFQANRLYQKHIEDETAKGKPYEVAAQEALALYGPSLTGSRTGYRNPGMTELQQNSVRQRQQQLDQKASQFAERQKTKMELEADKQAAQKSKPRAATQAVAQTYRTLLALETQATMDGDAGKANDARWRKEAFVREHPELGLTPNTDTATGTWPGMPESRVVAPAGGKGQLTKAQALMFKKQAGGDLDKARELARAAGYTF